MTPTPGDPLRHPGKRAILTTWAALSAATVLAWLLTPGDSPTTTANNELVAAIVTLALLKSRLILRTFMEVRHAPRPLQHTTDAWLLTLWLSLLTLYLL